jgi:hypothetical protein
MAAANASARGQRDAILLSPLHELTGFYLAVDPGCAAEPRYAVAGWADINGSRRVTLTGAAVIAERSLTRRGASCYFQRSCPACSHFRGLSCAFPMDGVSVMPMAGRLRSRMAMHAAKPRRPLRQACEPACRAAPVDFSPVPKRLPCPTAVATRRRFRRRLRTLSPSWNPNLPPARLHRAGGLLPSHGLMRDCGRRGTVKRSHQAT